MRDDPGPRLAGTRADDWRAVLVGVHDGGDCYFTVEYGAKRGTFSRFTVNGEA